MAILAKGNDFADGDDVTSTKLDNLVDNATFVSGSSGTTDDSSLEVNGSGRLQIKDSGVTTGKIDASAVTTSKIASATGTSDGVTFAKIRHLENMKLIGNVSGSTAAPTQVSILDEDDMSSDSATSVPTQQSVKAYVDNGGGLSPSTYTGGETTTLPNGMILKTGKVSTPVAATNEEHTVTFGTAFPNGVISISLTPLNTLLTGNDNIAAQVWNSPAPSTTGFTFRLWDNQYCAETYWMAIGY